MRDNSQKFSSSLRPFLSSSSSLQKLCPVIAKVPSIVTSSTFLLLPLSRSKDRVLGTQSVCSPILYVFSEWYFYACFFSDFLFNLSRGHSTVYISDMLSKFHFSTFISLWHMIEWCACAMSRCWSETIYDESVKLRDTNERIYNILNSLIAVGKNL